MLWRAARRKLPLMVFRTDVKYHVWTAGQTGGTGRARIVSGPGLHLLGGKWANYGGVNDRLQLSACVALMVDCVSIHLHLFFFTSHSAFSN